MLCFSGCLFFWNIIRICELSDYSKMVYCVAPNCKNGSETGRGMFTFPKKSANPKLNLLWRKNMGRAASDSPFKLWENTATSRLCDEHFEEHCFIPPSPRFARSIGFRPGKFQLVSGAVPTIFNKSKSGEAVQPKQPRGAYEKRQRQETISHILHEETASFTCNVSSFAVAAEVMVETEDSDLVVTSMNETECGLMDLDARQHTDDHTTLEDMDGDTTVTPFVTEDHTYNQPIRANPSKKNSRQKGVQTPKRWTSKPAVNVRSSGSQAAPVMVDKACQCDPTETVDNQQPLPQPAPKTTATLNDSFLSETSEPMEDDLMDEDYLPDYDEEEPDESDFDEEINIEEEDHHKERKYVVFESCLSQLLSVCRFCSGKAAVIRKRTIGTLVIFQAVCTQESEHIYTWISQPMKGGLPVGNLILSAAMLFSGSSPVKSVNTLKFSNIQTFCLRTFYTIQGLYLLPAISATWEKEQEEMFSSIQAAVNVGGDARCCSPGHTAKYGSYSLMDLETSKVLDIQLVQSSEVANSNAMELEGLKRCISRLQEEGIEISDFTTDRHPQVKKYMREQHPGTNHWYDVWHVAKGVKKKVEAASKKKQCDVLGRWSQSISNHLYYCAAFSNGDGELLVDMWKSVLNHVADIHTGHGSRFPDCQHGEIDGEREWIKKGSKPYKELKEVVERTGLVKDIQKLSPAHQTYSLESYHKICCFFATKFVHFFYLSMEGRLKLACLHYNENACKPQAVSKTGDPIWQVSRPKYKKGAPVAKQVKVAVTYGYIDRLMDEVLERRSLFKSYNESRADLKDVFASTPKPVSHKYETIDKKAVVSAHRSRFNRSDS